MLTIRIDFMCSTNGWIEVIGTKLVIPSKICDELSRQQPKFPAILILNDQMTLKVKVPYFQYKPIWCKLCYSTWNPFQVMAQTCIA